MQYSSRISCRWQMLLFSLAVWSGVASAESSSLLTSFDRRLRVRGGVRGDSSSANRDLRRSKKSDSSDSSNQDEKKTSKNIFAEEEQASSFDTEFKGNNEASSDEEGGEIVTADSMDDLPPMAESNHTSGPPQASAQSSSNTQSSRKSSSHKSSNKLSKMAKKRKYSSRSKVKDSNKLKKYGDNNMNSFDDEVAPPLESSSNDRPITPTLSPVASTPKVTPTPSQAPITSTDQPTRGPEPTEPPQTETPAPTSSPPTSLPTNAPISNPSTSVTVPTIDVVRATLSPTASRVSDTVPTVTEFPIFEGDLDNDNALVEWDCPANVVQFQTEIEVDFIGSPELLTAEEISSLERTFSTLYNTETLVMCDTYARTIINSELQFSNGNGGFVYSISAVCRDCPTDTSLLQEGTVATKALPKDTFTFSLEADYFSQLTTKQQQQRSSSSSQSYFGFFEVEETAKRGGKGSRSLQVFDTCFCPAGVEPTTPMAPTKEEFLAIQNEAVEELREAGVLTNIEGISRLEEL